VFVLFYNLQWGAAQVGPMLLVLMLGTWALTVIGTLFSALTVNLRLRELMLPTLVYPMMIPALIAAITVTTNVLDGSPPGLGIRLLAAFDIIFTLLAVVFVDTVLVG
jgi:heme exporter protein B